MSALFAAAKPLLAAGAAVGVAAAARRYSGGATTNNTVNGQYVTIVNGNATGSASPAHVNFGGSMVLNASTAPFNHQIPSPATPMDVPEPAVPTPPSGKCICGAKVKRGRKVNSCESCWRCADAWYRLRSQGHSVGLTDDQLKRISKWKAAEKLTDSDLETAHEKYWRNRRRR